MKRRQDGPARTLYPQAAWDGQDVAPAAAGTCVDIDAHGRKNGCEFRPAFMDMATGTIYPSRFADGRPAPCHLLEGLPEEAIAQRDAAGAATAARDAVIAGFVRHGLFYLRTQVFDGLTPQVSAVSDPCERGATPPTYGPRAVAKTGDAE